MIFSKKCEYALQALVVMAVHSRDKALVSVKDITDHLGIPRAFIAKIFQELVRKKLVISRKGKNGGFILARKPEKMKLCEVIIAIEGSMPFDSCLLGFDKCNDKVPCVVHHKWKHIKADVMEFLDTQTLGDVKSLEMMQKRLDYVKTGK